MDFRPPAPCGRREYEIMGRIPTCLSRRQVIIDRVRLGGLYYFYSKKYFLLTFCRSAFLLPVPCILRRRAAGALRFCLAAERIIREGTRQGDALFPRASPLQKQSAGLFLNSPPARGIVSGVFRRLRTATRGSSRLPARSALLSLQFHSVPRGFSSDRGL